MPRRMDRLSYPGLSGLGVAWLVSWGFLAFCGGVPEECEEETESLLPREASSGAGGGALSLPTDTEQTDGTSSGRIGPLYIALHSLKNQLTFHSFWKRSCLSSTHDTEIG